MRTPVPAVRLSTTVPGPEGGGVVSVMSACLRCASDLVAGHWLAGASARRFTVSGRVVEPVVGGAEVGECVQERGLDTGGSQPVGDLARGRVRRVGLVDQGVGQAGDGPQ